jgi:large subunit ribosomal protein L15
VINLFDLEKLTLKEISLETLTEAGKVKGRYDRLTVLATGELTKAFIVKAHRVSASAQEKIVKAGGKVELLPIPGKKPLKGKEKKAQA